MKKKTIALLMAAVMLFGVTVGSTIAWLTDQTENEVGIETNAQIASIVAGLKAASTMTEEEATAMFKQLLMAQLQLDPTDADQVAYFESLYNTVFGFLDGTVTSEQVADTFLPYSTSSLYAVFVASKYAFTTSSSIPFIFM